MRISVCAILCCASSALAAPTLSDAALDALLAESPRTHRPVGSIAELVPLLPEALRESFTFVHTSRSPFTASITPALPRVILFSDDATLVLTFIGDPQAPGHDILESMRFDPETARFELRARSLPAAGVAPPSSASCAACHGDDPRPIYDAYPLWPGFYGSAQDDFPEELPSSVLELEQYRGFLRTAARTGVYAGLRWVLGSPVSPYLDPSRSRTDELHAPASDLYYQPNTRLGMALTELNRKRIYRKLADAPSFDARRALAELLDCVPDRTLAAEAEHLRPLVEAEDAAKSARFGTTTPRLAMQELRDLRALAQLDRIARRAGIDRTDWSMALEPGSLAFYDGILGAEASGGSHYLKEDLELELLEHLAARDPELAPYVRTVALFAPLGFAFGHKLDLVRARRACRVLR